MDAPAPTNPAVPNRPNRVLPLPYESGELDRFWARPLIVFDVVLSAPERIAASLDRERVLGPLVAVMLVAGAAFAIPYGLVHGSDAWWRIAALYLGSTAICLPSLHVFASYVGVRIRVPQTAVLALVLPATASLFTFGFAPILAFLRATMGPEAEAGKEASHVAWQTLSVALLWLALLAGIGQLARALAATRRASGGTTLILVLIAWHGVFLYVLARMAEVLGLDGAKEIVAP